MEKTINTGQMYDYWDLSLHIYYNINCLTDQTQIEFSIGVSLSNFSDWLEDNLFEWKEDNIRVVDKEIVLSTRISETPLPGNCKMLVFDKYDWSRDLNKNIQIFMNQMVLYTMSDAIWCRVFLPLWRGKP